MQLTREPQSILIVFSFALRLVFSLSTIDSSIIFVLQLLIASQKQFRGFCGAEPPSFSIQFEGFGFSKPGIRCFIV